MIGEKLKTLRESRNYSQAYVADTLGIGRVNYNRYENNNREPDGETLKILADFYGVTTDELLGRENHKNFDITKLSNYVGKVVENKKIPIIGTVKCGPNGLAFEDVEGYISIDDDLTGDIFALRCKGDSMKFEEIKDGDIAIVRRQDDVECGELAVVIVNGDEGTLKKVRKIEGGIILEAANPDYPSRVFIGEDLNKIKIVGKVLETRRKR